MRKLIDLRTRIEGILSEEKMPSHYDRQVASRFRSKVVPLEFRDVILAHNDAADFDEFLLHTEEILGGTIEPDDLKKWADRVRQAIAKWRAKLDDDRMLEQLLVTKDQIDAFMNNPKRPVPIDTKFVAQMARA